MILEQVYLGPMNKELKETFELYHNLIHLSMNQTYTFSLKLFPKLPSLRILELKDNSISDKDLIYIKEKYPQLYSLDISDNLISKVMSFNVLEDIPLSILKLKGNPLLENISNESKAYKTISQMIPTLEIIDDTSTSSFKLYCTKSSKETVAKQSNTVSQMKKRRRSNPEIIVID